ncbi:hypothetical protein PanWU01x14_352200 [Parasponia andersonii]|uniref:Uncharacterized protein n=1 Tax=Parasponia andersonii TaxID=3476 RepID=A0A2P5AAD7_PARAD|nr:hypothetical protein PanWU01x14_352200 [Parasponia andersonii]
MDIILYEAKKLYKAMKVVGILVASYEEIFGLQRSTPYCRQSIPKGTIVPLKGPEYSRRNQSVPEGIISHIWALARHTLFTNTFQDDERRAAYKLTVEIEF